MRSVALVTGAGRGLGRVLATFLAGQGHDLVISARTDTELEEVARSLRSTGAKVAAFPGNITDPGHRTRLLQETSAMGGVSLLVNNASDLGETPRPELAQASLDLFRTTLETNLVAPLALIQEALPQLERTRGLIVNITATLVKPVTKDGESTGPAKPPSTSSPKRSPSNSNHRASP